MLGKIEGRSRRGQQRIRWLCCRKEDPFQGPKLGSCLTLGNELSEETRADKARDFIGKGHPGGEQEGKGTQENCSAVWLAIQVLW